MEETIQTESLLWCNTCQKWKPCIGFSKNKRSKRGYQSKCKECNKQYRKDKTDKIKQSNKQWREENADKIKKYNKKYYQENSRYIKERNKRWKEENVDRVKEKIEEYIKNNKDYIKQYQKQYNEDNFEYLKKKRRQYQKDNIDNIKQYNNSPFKSDDKSKRLEEIKKYESCIVDSDNDINFQCAYCGDYFKATKTQIWHRLDAINGQSSDGAEMRLYCSEKCKDECPIYKQVSYSKDQKPATSREVQPQLRQMVLARDNYTCQKCGKHKDELEVGLHCHHIYPLNESPITSADIDECITYCKDCHKEVHMNVPGCGYGEMRCSE